MSFDDDDVGDAETAGLNESVIYYSGAPTIGGLPTRASILKKLVSEELMFETKQIIDKCEPLIFLPNDVVEQNEAMRNDEGLTIKTYKLHLHGILETGQKAHVIVDGIEVYFDVRVPKRANIKDFETKIKQLLMAEDIPYTLVETVMAKPFKGFVKNPVAWKRIYFNNVQHRKAALNLIIDNGMSTASDDKSNYFRMAARNHGTVLTSWVVLDNYEAYTGGMHEDGMHTEGYPIPATAGVEYIIRLNINDITPQVDPMAEPDEQAEQLAVARPVDQDRTIVCGWDIETYDTSNDGEVPQPKKETSHIFMICMTFHFKDDPKAFYKVCLVDIETAVDDRWKTIVCGDEINIIKAFSIIFGMMSPDIITGFNDQQYDWPFIIEKSLAYGIIGEVIHHMSPRYKAQTNAEAFKWNVTIRKRVKTGAGNDYECTFIKVPGCVPVDTRMMLMKQSPKAPKTSLNYFLGDAGIKPKADMPYKVMDNYYKTRNTVMMRNVAHYCIIDCMRCPQLLIKKNIIGDKRELSALAYTSFYDAVFYADGHKIRNMAGAYANAQNKLIGMIGRDIENKAKFGGAFVFNPKKGCYPNVEHPSFIAMEKLRDLVATGKLDISTKEGKAEFNRVVSTIMYGRPVTGLDFSSLYPSIMMAYNLSPDMFVETEKEARELEAEGYTLHHSEIQFKGRTVHGWFVRHGNNTKNYGLLVDILIKLFNKRKLLKNEMHKYGKIIENMTLVYGNATRDGIDIFESIVRELEVQKKLHADLMDAGKKGDDVANNVDNLTNILDGGDVIEAGTTITLNKVKIIDFFNSEYARIGRLHATIKSKQGALKIYMNTFYGEMGNQMSSLYLLQLAAGVTSMGQYNIKYAAEYVIGRKYDIIYGDTDSIYISCPNSYFRKIDEEYVMGITTMEEYYTKMVQITMDELALLKVEVNNHLAVDNGTKFLKMAYEEVLYPVVFVGKKKYFGTAHENVINFHPKEIFIRGIESIKQGNSKLLITTSDRIMWTIIDITNRFGMRTVVETTLTDMVAKSDTMDPTYFIKSAVWKPHKQNITVHKFVSRMRVKVDRENMVNKMLLDRNEEPNEKIYRIPANGERFNYIIVKQSREFDLSGKVIRLKVGERMEYDTVVQSQKMPIDMIYYMSGKVIGLCSRFINFYADFRPPGAYNTPELQKMLDKAENDNATKYLKVFIEGLQGIDKVVNKKRGYAYKRAWKKAANSCYHLVQSKLGRAADMLHGKYLTWSDFLSDEYQQSVDTFVEIVDRYVEDNRSVDSLKQYAICYCSMFDIDNSGGDCDGGVVTSTAHNLYQLQTNFISTGRKTNALNYMLSEFDQLEAKIRKDLYNIMAVVSHIANKYESTLESIVDYWRNVEHKTHTNLGGEYVPDTKEIKSESGITEESLKTTFDYMISTEDIAQLSKLRGLWDQLVSIKRSKDKILFVNKYITNLKNTRVTPERPIDVADIVANIIADAQSAEMEDYSNHGPW